MSTIIYLQRSWIATLPVFCLFFILRIPPWVLRRLVWPYLLEPIGIWPFPVVARKGLPIMQITIVAALCYTRFRSITQLISLTDSDAAMNCPGIFSFQSSFHDFATQQKSSFPSGSCVIAETNGLLDVFIAKIYQLLYIIFTYGCSRTSNFQEKSIAHIYMAYKLLINDLLGLFLIHSILRNCVSFHHITWREIKESMISSIYEFCKDNIHLVQQRVKDEEEKIRVSMQSSLKVSTWAPTLTLPKHGRDHPSIIQQLTKYSAKENQKWKDGYVSGTVYAADDEHSKLLTDVYHLYSLSNPLHPDVWPSVNMLEAEVCAMTASLLNGGNTNVCGCFSSGGTESILLAVKAHRQYFGQRRGIKHPEVISCQTAHVGLDKACELLGIRNIRVPIDPRTFQIDWKLVESYITMNTIMIYASAPCYPQGVIDPISELSSIAMKHKVGLHVDCCLGGFVLPFAKRLGYPNIPDFDFTLPGVTSMSCDTHKYGYSTKGSSVVLYSGQVSENSMYLSPYISRTE
jgi:hypothetical protein